MATHAPAHRSPARHSAEPLARASQADEPSGVDLRLRRRRDASSLIVELAQHLPPQERGLLEAVYAKGHSVQEVARMLGLVTPGQARILRRRIRNLVTRISETRFAFVAHSRHAWPPTRRRVGELCVLHGMSMRHAARELGISLYAVRQHNTLIDALHKAAAETSRRARSTRPHGSRPEESGGSR